MLNYRGDLKPLARTLRSNMTEAEQKLWFHIRRKQILGVQFYLQRTIGKFIVDFYAPTAKLVIEIDGSQHLEPAATAKDATRTAFLASQNLDVVRFDNLQVLNEIQNVFASIHSHINEKKTREANGVRRLNQS